MDTHDENVSRRLRALSTDMQQKLVDAFKQALDVIDEVGRHAEHAAMAGALVSIATAYRSAMEGCSTVTWAVNALTDEGSL